MALSTLYEFPFGFEANPWRAITRINAETIYLFTNRAQAYLDFSKNLNGSQTTDDFLTQQVTFWQVAQQQYLNSFHSAAFGDLPIAAIVKTGEGQSKRSRDYIVVSEPTLPAATSAKDAVQTKQSKPERLRRSA